MNNGQVSCWRLQMPRPGLPTHIQKHQSLNLVFLSCKPYNTHLKLFIFLLYDKDLSDFDQLISPLSPCRLRCTLHSLTSSKLDAQLQSGSRRGYDTTIKTLKDLFIGKLARTLDTLGTLRHFSKLFSVIFFSLDMLQAWLFQSTQRDQFHRAA